MRQGVVITLIVMGALLAAIPLFTGAFELWSITQDTASIPDVNAVLPEQISAYPWVCLGVGLFLIGTGIVGEWLAARGSNAMPLHTAKTT